LVKQKFPAYFYNPITLGGVVISVVSFGLILFLIVLESLAEEQKPYMGIIAFVILPSFLFIGIVLIGIGVYREFRKEQLGKKVIYKYPKIDLNDRRTRAAFLTISFVGIVFLAFSAFGSFKAYEYTDSDEFCGTVCHKVMEPEFVAYQSSPHARVGCVQCHIGSGADWFVRAKISGAYQVYSVLFNKYSRPIPTPVEHLRPAQQTCEQCHWPKHFFSEKRVQYTNYMSDEKNTRFDIDLILKVGGGNIDTGPTSGIHWHMNIVNDVYYIASDKKRLEIPYVRTVGKDGKVEEYYSTDSKLNEAEIKKGELRKMDCMDCHNRPSHNYHAPAPSVNHLLSLNLIDKNLPFIKSLAVEALDHPYTNNRIAMDSIAIKIRDFYTINYAEISKTRNKEIEQTILELQRLYSRNYFPEMNVSWTKYPEHIGHMFSPGCFRCHDGRHVSKTGKTITFDCNACHSILKQKFEDKEEMVSVSGLTYTHPIDIGEAWKKMICSDCHNKK